MASAVEMLCGEKNRLLDSVARSRAFKSNAKALPSVATTATPSGSSAAATGSAIITSVQSRSAASRLEPTEPPAAVLLLLLVCRQGRGEVAHAPDRVRHVAALVVAVPERGGPVFEREPVFQERDSPVGIMAVAGPHRAVR